MKEKLLVWNENFSVGQRRKVHYVWTWQSFAIEKNVRKVESDFYRQTFIHFREYSRQFQRQTMAIATINNNYYYYFLLITYFRHIVRNGREINVHSISSQDLWLFFSLCGKYVLSFRGTTIISAFFFFEVFLLRSLTHSLSNFPLWLAFRWNWWEAETVYFIVLNENGVKKRNKANKQMY